MKKGFSAFLAILFLTSFSLTNLPLVKSLEIISIDSDGNIIGTDKLLREGNSYVFTGNIQGSIVVEKDDIVIDGQGYALQGLDNQGYGIELFKRSGVTITNTRITDFSTCIFVDYSSNCIFSENYLENYYKGIRIGLGLNNTISKNNFISNLPFQGQTVLEYVTRKGTAIVLYSSSSNYVYQNHVEGNMFGMELESQSGWPEVSSKNNKIFDNVLINNDYGIVTRIFYNNEFYHNSLISNTLHVYDWNDIEPSFSSSENIWDKGYLVGGNFWDSANGEDNLSGLMQNETCADGIIDISLFIDEKNEDNYPLAKPWQDHLNPPVARFFYSSDLLYALEKISFNASQSYDLDDNIDSFQWDFDDGNITSTKSSILNHTFSLPGLYNVSLTVFDEKGLNTTYSKVVKIIASSSISVLTTSKVTSAGFTVDINGTLSSMFQEPLENQNILLSYTFEGANKWFLISSAATDNLGNFWVVWVPTATGQFSIKSEWNGNETYAPASNITNLNILFQDEEYLFGVESNSTISSLSFDSNSQELHFVVDGPTGTKGYVRITVSRSLVDEISFVEVLIDNEKVEYSASMMDGSWLLLVNYSHSTHDFLVCLTSSIFPINDNELLNLVLAGMIIIAIVGGFIYLIKKRKTNHDFWPCIFFLYTLSSFFAMLSNSLG